MVVGGRRREGFGGEIGVGGKGRGTVVIFFCTGFEALEDGASGCIGGAVFFF